MTEAVRLLLDAVSSGWRQLSRTRRRLTPPRYAMRMFAAKRWHDYIRKPNVFPKSRRTQNVL